jgi:predicted small secreted protein
MKIVITILFFSAMIVIATGCETVKGVGKDVESAGRAIKKSASWLIQGLFNNISLLGMRHLLKYQSRLSFCPCFSSPLWLHSSLCARRGNKNHKQKSCTSWYFNFCLIPYFPCLATTSK